MIRKIEIDNVPPYIGNRQIIEPKKVNFIFGLNGSGKTTISRFISSPDDYKYRDCNLDWDGTKLNCCVYNRDFVQNNFSESSIPGIFTLGQENIETKKKIEDLNRDIQSLQDRQKNLKEIIDGSESLVGLNQQKKAHEEKYNNKFWNIKQQLDQNSSPLNLALAGARGSKEIFKKKVLEENDNNRAVYYSREELEKLCIQLFGNNVEKVETILPIDFRNILVLEKSDILQKIIVGKEDVDIAGLIKKMENESWFKQGIKYIDKSEGKCPFCQRELEQDFSRKVTEYFDESYRKDNQKLIDFQNSYNRETNVIINRLETLLKKESNFIKKDDLEIVLEKIRKIVEANLKHIKNKVESPNEIIVLETLGELAKTIEEIVNETNSSIVAHNNRVANLHVEQKNLTKKVWRYILNELKEDIKDYITDKGILIKKLDDANDEFKSNARIIFEKAAERKQLEQQLTSILPTANAINNLLKSYGFTGFSIEVDDSEHNYRFVRESGEPAFESLSEGERNFVTFLYFMYSLNGNVDASGHNEDKVVVVDDPVSSMDSDVLFIVSSLLRDLFENIYNNKATIKQIFILSHNLYFFKEVSYKVGLRKLETGYWLIRKIDNISDVIYYQDNPVSSTYEMLWDEIRIANENPENYNATLIANIMRRILEHYFQILGGCNINKIHMQFPPNGERQVIKSLLSWANAGSHSSFDDFSATPNIYDVKRYLKLFKDLFDKTGHIAHYNMMMRIESEEEPNG